MAGGFGSLLFFVVWLEHIGYVWLCSAKHTLYVPYSSIISVIDMKHVL